MAHLMVNYLHTIHNGRVISLAMGFLLVKACDYLQSFAASYVVSSLCFIFPPVYVIKVDEDSLVSLMFNAQRLCLRQACLNSEQRSRFIKSLFILNRLSAISCPVPTLSKH